jgi:tetratricopeptide (TPR) repeat protein
MSIKKFMFRNTVIAAALAVTVAMPVAASEVSDVTALVQTRQFANALAKADTYLAGHPDDADMRFLKGISLVGLGRKPDAITQFRQLVADHPANAEAANNLAVLYASDGLYDDARQTLEKAVKARPGYARGYENLGDIYSKLATQAYAAALKIEPDNTDAETKAALIGKAIGTHVERTAPVVAGGGKALDKSESANVLAAVDGWSKAWSTRDFPAYLSYYSQDFQTPKGKTRSKWEAQRRRHIERKRFIKVQVLAPDTTVEGSRATVRFTQIYSSNNHASKDHKALVLEKQQGQWKIVQETTES